MLSAILSSWLQQENVLLGHGKTVLLEPGMSAQPPLSKEEETKNVLGETQRSSKTFCLRKVGVLTVTEIISILDPTYISH